MTDLRQFTSARVAQERAGNSISTRELLQFQLAHARARDAVYFPLDAASLKRELPAGSLVVRSAAPDRATYLKRPDLGRRLSPDSRGQLTHTDAPVALIIADGLSAIAVHRHAPGLVSRIRSELGDAPIVIVEQGRVAIGDEIGELLGAEISVILIGERPGLSSPDSLGVYVTWSPRVGRTDAERNCISNIRDEGLSLDAAGQLLLALIRECQQRKLSGVALKPSAALLP